jgi:hypothetical protein
VINNLSVNGLLELAKGPNGGLLYKSVAREQASMYKTGLVLYFPDLS